MYPMKQKSLLQLVPPPSERDYLEHFQSLASVNLEIRQRGPTADRLLRKSILEMDVGNFTASLDAARDAAELHDEDPEARYQEGMALVMLAFTKAGVLAGSPGMEPPLASASTLLKQAADAFARVVKTNPEDDESKEDLAALARFLAEHPSEEELEKGLQGLWAH